MIEPKVLTCSKRKDSIILALMLSPKPTHRKIEITQL